MTDCELIICTQYSIKYTPKIKNNNKRKKLR